MCPSLVVTGNNPQSLTIIDDGAANGTYSSSSITISGEFELSACYLLLSPSTALFFYNNIIFL
jgi:hypothetical protein